MEFPHFLTSQLQNQFVGGGLLLMVTGSVIALARSMPARLYEWAKRRLTIEVEVLNSDPLFDYVTFWLDSQAYSKRSRRLTATTTNLVVDRDENDGPTSPGEYGEHNTLKVFLSPAPGRHVFLYRGNILWLERNRDRASAPSGSTSGNEFSFLKKSEQYNLTLFGRRQSVIRELINEIVKFGSHPTETIKLFHSTFGYFRSHGVMRPRKLDTVVLPAGIAESVMEDAKKFLISEDWYRSVGIPWHRGYMFHGLPGTGKTSLVSALAGELRMNLYLLNISGAGMDDERLSSLMAEVQPRSLVLMEDVDCTIPDRASKEKKNVTLSGLLNCLDGVQSREGCMIFMTTNNIAALDSALIRPGRVDVSIEFGYATREQMIRLRDRLAPDVPMQLLLESCHNATMAEVQKFLLSDKISVIELEKEATA